MKEPVNRPGAGTSLRGSSSLLWGCAAGVVLSLAWYFPNQPLGAALGWLAAPLLVGVSRSTKPYRAAWVTLTICHSLGFYWLFDTIRLFGGFGVLPSLVIFLLFAFLSGLQGPLWILLVRSQPQWLRSSSLSVAAGWVGAEILNLRIFPWQLGHTQLGFLYFAQAADLSGVTLLSFVMLWVGEAVWRCSCFSFKSLRPALPPFLGVLLLVGYGIFQVLRVPQYFGAAQKVALVQANIAVEQKDGIRYFAQNSQRYVELSRPYQDAHTLIIWPESVLQFWIDAGLKSLADDPRLVGFNRHTPMLVGALTFKSERELFNSALGIYPDGTLPRPYNKQILMPFGEYTPFGSTLTFLRELNGTVGEYTAGTSIALFSYPTSAGPPLLVSPLICYEDILPALGRAATRAGAEILVNLTNDAWFGDTLAPFQHHQIAAFRAIENRRYLLRSTNSGLTAIVNPLGETVATLPPFSEGVLTKEVRRLSISTPFSSWGEYPWWVVTGFSVLGVVVALGRVCRPKGRAHPRE